MKKENQREYSRQFKTPFTHQFIFGEQLHLCPSHNYALPRKSLNFLFNKFDPYFHNILFHSFIHKFKFYPYCEFIVLPFKIVKFLFFHIPQKLRMLQTELDRRKKAQSSLSWSVIPKTDDASS